MIIAVASGHTKSLLLAYSREAGISYHNVRLGVDDPSLNLHSFPPETVTRRLRSMLDAVKQHANTAAFGAGDRLAISLPGVSTPHDLELSMECIHGAGWPIDLRNQCNCVDDTWAGLVAGVQATVGICAFAGSGASVFVGDGWPYVMGKPCKLDGWGPLIGDFGSGFRLGMTTLEELCIAIDANQDVTTLLARIPLLERLLREERDLENELSNPLGIQNWFDRLLKIEGEKWRLRVAKLAIMVTEAAAAGDDFAKQRVRDSALGMIKTLRTAFKRFPHMEGKPVTCHGGMFRHSDLYYNEVKMRIEESYGSPVSRSDYHPVVGALLMAAADDWSVPPDDVTDRILQHIEDLEPQVRRSFVLTASTTT
jgi:N-acetylglucosamine kinase-like BadF-type ATPase